MLPTVKTTFWHQLGLDVLTYDNFERIAVNNIPFVVSNSSNGLDMFKEDYTVDPNKLNILPQYTSLEFRGLEKTRIRAKFGISEENLVIGMIAHFRPEKLHSLLLNAFEVLSDNYPNLILLLVGNKNNTSVTLEKFNLLKENIEEMRLSTKVMLLSEVNVSEMLNIMDIGVLVSEIEGMPNSVMEYMLYGLPVVATNHPGCKYLLEDSEFLISNKEDDLVNSLEKLVLDEQLREDEGLKNKTLIKNYDMESYVSKLSDIMDKYSN
jgi:glycosyltransferase involved in cell wall biosynthesis